MQFSRLATALVLAAALALSPALAQAAITINLLHFSDQEGNADTVINAPNLAAIIDYYDDESNTMILGSGDLFIPGAFLNAGADGDTVEDALAEVLGLPDANNRNARVDIAINELIGVQAVAIGNHDFDLGESGLLDAIGTEINDEGDGAYEIEWLGAPFPYLSANLDFSASSLNDVFTSEVLDVTAFAGSADDPAAAQTKSKIAPSATLVVGGETFGLVGATTPVLESLSSTGDVTVKDPGAGTNSMSDLAGVIQPTIDALEALGVNKIILLAHMQQIALEEELLPLLSGVDICIAGGSDTILADDNDTLRTGDEAADTYPIQTTNADGDPALIVNTDGQYLYIGRLVVTFDDAGVIDLASLDSAVNGAIPTTTEQVVALWGSESAAFADGAKGAQVKTLTDAVRDVLVAADGEVWGETTVFLNGERSGVRTRATNLGYLTALANLDAAQAVDSTVVASIKNGGGIRASIGEVITYGTEAGTEVPPQANDISGKETGQISSLDIDTSLAFDNSLSILTLSAQDLWDVIEHGVAATEEGATPGQFPQVAGLAFSYDPTQEAGSRVQTLVIIDETTGLVSDIVVQNGALVADASSTYRIVTLGFLAGGGDGYPFEDLAENIVDTELGEQQVMKDFLAANFPTSDVAASSYSLPKSAFATTGTAFSLSDDDFESGDVPIILDTSSTTDTLADLAVGDEVSSGSDDDDDDDGCVLNPAAGFSPELLLLLAAGLGFALRRRVR